MNVVYPFKSVTEEQGETSLYSIYCFNSKYNVHTSFTFLSILNMLFYKNSINWIFTILTITTLLARS